MSVKKGGAIWVLYILEQQMLLNKLWELGLFWFSWFSITKPIVYENEKESHDERANFI